MHEQIITLPPGKKIYFASDFHLGVPDNRSSLEREKCIVEWLENIRIDAHSIYLLGDLFDFWFEYRSTVPKGFIRLLGKIAELSDSGIPIFFFTGNHDMWMFDYFPKELGVSIIREPILIKTDHHKMMVGHGDGLGPGDRQYKFLKRIFKSAFSQWLFARIHPNLGTRIAHSWSKRSRISNMKREEKFMGEENEFLLKYCKEVERKTHHDFYVFGHRHLALDLEVGAGSRYINTGEWVHGTPYAVYDGATIQLKNFK
ncbi:MAG: UDP-2,3-diacylglucosamine diphosphatase [Flammeovirgaceae bacterium]|nr:UDP-2,3-diacylglucosamine diphosphatase [Flammeovirgaceae bacterium]